MVGKLRTYTKEELQNILDNSRSYKEVLSKVGLCETGSNRKTLRKVIDDYNLDLTKISINFNNFKKNNFGVKVKHEKSLDDILNNKTPYYSGKLIKRLIREGIKNNICEKCGIENWNNEPLTMQLHHIDGNSKNNLLNNLQVLCPNCHSQTDNYAGRKMKKVPKIKSMGEIQQSKTLHGISEDGQRYYDGYGGYKILCPECKTNFMTTSSKLCRECYQRLRKQPKISKEELYKLVDHNSYNAVAEILGVDRNTVSAWYEYYIKQDIMPNRDELKNELRNLKSFVGVGRIFNVTDNAVRKWCKKYNLPFKTSAIKALSENDWDSL